MGIGGFLAAQSDRAQFLYLTRATEIRLQSACASELRRETFGILAPLGLDAVSFEFLDLFFNLCR